MVIVVLELFRHCGSCCFFILLTEEIMTGYSSNLIQILGYLSNLIQILGYLSNLIQILGYLSNLIQILGYLSN